jgi:glycosyltransferase involved in cell wall biosynthesis
LKILTFNYEYPPIGGGGGVICRDIAEELVAMGNSVTVITSLFAGLNKNEKVNGVDVVRVPVLFRKKQNVASVLSLLSYVPSSIRKANELLKQNKYDVINTHFAIPSGPAGHRISNGFKIPNVLSIHGGDIFDPSKSLSPHHTPGLKQTVKKMLNSADRVVAQSSDTQNNASYFYNVKRSIDIVPLGIKPNGFANKTRNDLNLKEDNIIFTTIGRLIKRKNLEELLEIIGTVKESFPCELLIIGDGPERNNLEQKISAQNISQNVKLLGRVTEEEKFQYLAASDAYLSTAIHEGFGIVFLEAMECGIPVICYDRGGQIDFLQNGNTGFLVKLGDKNTFISRIFELLNNRKLSEHIKTFNKKYISSFYISNIAAQYLTIFKQVAA